MENLKNNFARAHIEAEKLNAKAFGTRGTRGIGMFVSAKPTHDRSQLGDLLSGT